MDNTLPLSRVSSNGTARKETRNKPQTGRKQAGRKVSKLAQRVALGVGSVGVGVLGLSVHHCTEAISLLTGSHWALAGLLAIGIDAGMVASELAELAAHGSKAERSVGPWANGYVVGAVFLSVMPNSYAFALPAAAGMGLAAWPLGPHIPCLAYTLGRGAGRHW